jgi:glycosyltransferase involved in cell wall biosynthesis
MEEISKVRVLVTFDAMRYPNTGLYSFGKSLGKALLRYNNGQFDFDYFLYPGVKDFDNDGVHKTYFKKYNKFFFFNSNNIRLFHFTDQFSRLKPKKVFGSKKILTIHDINQVHEKISTQQLDLYLKKLGERINSCDKVITISKFAANDVLNYFPHVANKLSVIYNGADKLNVKIGHQPAYLPSMPYLFTIGIVSAKKNFHVLPALLADNDLELIIAGNKTPYEERVLEQAKAYGCESRVKIIGPVSEDDKAWYYQNCEAFVFPSIAEGFGLPVIEAMHFGKPVFVSTLTSLPEIAGEAAYYFENFEGKEMQKVLKNGLKHFKENSMSEKVIAHAAKFTWDKTAQQYLQLYKSCLKA